MQGLADGVSKPLQFVLTNLGNEMLLAGDNANEH
jgi:hypothetical protein